MVTLSGNATTVNLPHTNIDDTFTITLLPPSDGGFQSVAVAQHSQQCLDNTNLSTADGNPQQQYHCEGGDQQLWNFRPVAGVANTYTVVNQQSGKCLDVSGASTADGAAVQQWTCTGGTNQQFTLRKVTYAGNDSHDYQLVARHSGKCVDVSGISTAPRRPRPPVDLQPGRPGQPAQPDLAALGPLTTATRPRCEVTAMVRLKACNRRVAPQTAAVPRTHGLVWAMKSAGKPRLNSVAVSPAAGRVPLAARRYVGGRPPPGRRGPHRGRGR